MPSLSAEADTPIAQREAAKNPPPIGLVVAAFAAVYSIWGSTFLGIAVAIQSIPPLLMSGVRWLVAGGLLLAVLRLRGVPWPEPRHWRHVVLVGALLLGAGNGGMTWAQHSVPSGLAALVVAATPLWTILFDWLRPHGSRPHRLVFAGLGLGFVGVILIIMGKDHSGSRVIAPIPGTVLLLATVSWAFGSVWSRHLEKPESALMSVAAQMCVAGPMLILTSVLSGEAAHFHPSAVTAASAIAFAYLTVFGSMIAFTAYAWLLEVTTPARSSTYAYVNPLIAVVLGRVVLGEPLPGTVLAAGAAILAGVVLITLHGRR